MALLSQVVLQKEYIELTGSAAQSSNVEAFQVRKVDQDLYHWRASVKGPPNTPYEGGNYELDINVPDRYPYYAPSVHFLTRIWHPNVDPSSGSIMLDVLDDGWKKDMNVRTVLQCIVKMMKTPDLKTPAHFIVADQFKTNPETFKKIATFWTDYFAVPREKNPDEWNFLETVVRKKHPEMARQVRELWELNYSFYKSPEYVIELASLHAWNIPKLTKLTPPDY